LSRRPPADEPPAQLRSLARGGGLNLVSSACSATANIGLVIVVTRGLSPVEAGVFFAATSMFLVATRISGLGTSTGLVYFFARSRALHRTGDLGRWLRIGLVPVAVVATLIALAMLHLAPQLAATFRPQDPSAATDLLRALAIFIPVAALSDSLLAATRGTGTMRPSALVEQLGRPALQLLLVLVAVGVGSGTAFAWALPYVPAAVLAWIWLRRLTARLAPEEAGSVAGAPVGAEREAGEPIGAFWRFTWPRAVTSVAQIALQRLDIILIAAIRGPAEAAVYTAATRFLVVGQLVGQAFTQAVQPMLAGALARRDLAAAQRLYRTGTCWLVLIAWPLYLSFALLAPAIMQVFGSQYAGGASVVVLLTLVMLVATGCGMVDTVLNMAGRTTWNLANVLLALAVNVTVDLLLIPRLGIEGAAIGWAAAILTNNLLPLAQVNRSLRLHPLGRGTLTAMALAVACFGVLPGIVRVADGNAVWVAGSLVVGALLYVPACWRFRRVLDLTALLATVPGRRGRSRPLLTDERPAERVVHESA
jgi:O-antigen/teichoic acid export membrane protein